MLPLLMGFAQIWFFNCQLVQEYNQNVTQQTDKHYHLAQVSPPGNYQIIIWSNLKGRNQNCQEIFFDMQRMKMKETDEKNNRQQISLYFRWNTLLWEESKCLAKCFGHFFSVMTDRNGQFLLEKNGTIKNGKVPSNLNNFMGIIDNYNVHIIPQKGEMAISHSFEHFAVQKVHSLPKNVPLDNLCQFGQNGQNKCILNYFTEFAEKESAIEDIFKHWFNTIPLSEKGNFFLIAILTELVNELKNRINESQQIDGQCAFLLGIFSKHFRSENNPLFDIVKLRLLDTQIIGLINEMCKINQQILFTSQLLGDNFKFLDFNDLFCEKWAPVLVKMLHFSKPEIAEDSFRQWLSRPNVNVDEQSTDEMSKLEEQRQIVKFWMTVLSLKMNYHCNKWTENDISMLRQIGEMLKIFIKSVANKSKERMNSLIESVNSELEFEKICRKFYDFNENCRQKERQLLLPWHNICARAEEQHHSNDDIFSSNGSNSENSQNVGKKLRDSYPKKSTTSTSANELSNSDDGLSQTDKESIKSENDSSNSGNKMSKKILKTTSARRESQKLAKNLSKADKVPLSRFATTFFNAGCLKREDAIARGRSANSRVLGGSSCMTPHCLPPLPKCFQGNNGQTDDHPNQKKQRQNDQSEEKDAEK